MRHNDKYKIHFKKHAYTHTHIYINIRPLVLAFCFFYPFLNLQKSTNA